MRYEFYLIILILTFLLILKMPLVLSAACPYTNATLPCKTTLTRTENAVGTIEYFSFTLNSITRISVTMTPATQTNQGPDYDLYTSWTADTCPYLTSTDCGYNLPGAGIKESCSRWLNPLPIGTYWVAVHHYDGGCTGASCGYKLYLDCQATTTSTTSTTSTTTTSTTSTTSTTIKPYTISCDPGSPGHYNTTTYNSTDWIESITVSNPTSLQCGQLDVPVTIVWYGKHNFNDNYWGFFVDNGTAWLPVDSCTSHNQVGEDTRNKFTMNCFVDMPQINKASDGPHKLNVTAEDWGGYCNPGERGVDAELGTSITLSNCSITSTSTTSTTSTSTTSTTSTSTTSTTSTSTTSTTSTSTTSTTTTSIIYCNKCPPKSIECKVIPNNKGEPPPQQVSYCKCLSDLEWYYFSGLDLQNNYYNAWENITPISTVDIELFANFTSYGNGCPTETSNDCWAHDYGFGQSEICSGTISSSGSGANYFLVKRTPLTPGVSYEINVTLERVPIVAASGTSLQKQIIAAQESEGCTVGIPIGGSIHCSAIYGDHTVEDKYHYFTVTNQNENIKITMKPDFPKPQYLADYVLRASRLPNLDPFEEPPEINRFYICYADKNKGIDGTQTCELTNLSPGKYNILVYHVKEEHARYGYTLEVKRVSQTSTTTSTIGQSGGGGGGRMPYMMDLINIIREFISKIFKI